jgi:hypothetical protein
VSAPEQRPAPDAGTDVEARVTGVELHCDECQQPYAVWFADNEVWNYVMSGGETSAPEWPGMLCPRCFTLKAVALIAAAKARGAAEGAQAVFEAVDRIAGGWPHEYQDAAARARARFEEPS